MPMVAAAVSVIGAGVSAYGSYAQGEESRKAQNANASVAEQEAAALRASGQREADIIGQNAVLNEVRARKELDKSKGTMVSSYAKRGVNFTGSPLDAIADSVSNAEMEIALGNYNSKIEADTALYNSKIGALNKESEARMRRLYGQNAVTNSLYSGAGTLLSSGSQAITRYKNEIPSNSRGYKTQIGQG